MVRGRVGGGLGGRFESVVIGRTHVATASRHRLAGRNAAASHRDAACMMSRRLSGGEKLSRWLHATVHQAIDPVSM